MKKSLLAFTVVALLIGTACSNWNRMTPKSMDSTTIEAEIRKNLAGDHITGLTVAVNNGVVTLGGHVKNATDRQTAEADAGKVSGVTSVVDTLTIS
jgi:osmotically-inducible protein OsmY